MESAVATTAGGNDPDAMVAVLRNNGCHLLEPNHHLWLDSEP